MPRLTPQTLKVLRAFVETEARLTAIALFHKTLLQSGTLYPMLNRLEKAGWLDSQKEPAQRHSYALTALGKAKADEVLNKIEDQTRKEHR